METALEKVLRLAGGVTRSYVRYEHGRPQRVSQYASRRNAALPGQLPQAQGRYGQPGQKQGASRSLTVGQLQPGHVVNAGGAAFTVVRSGPEGSPAMRNLGKGVHTGGAPNTASMGQGVNMPGGVDPQAALLGGSKVQPGTPVHVTELRDNRTGRRWFARLPAGLTVPVAG